VPALPGCISQGDTIAELLASVREAIHAWLNTEPPDDTPPRRSALHLVELSV
jgi:predicted RNase H-like HicB family nuclease